MPGVRVREVRRDRATYHLSHVGSRVSARVPHSVGSRRALIRFVMLLMLHFGFWNRNRIEDGPRQRAFEGVLLFLLLVWVSPLTLQETPSSVFDSVLRIIVAMMPSSVFDRMMPLTPRS